MQLDKAKAVAAVCAVLKQLTVTQDMDDNALGQFVTNAMDADLEYMRQAGVLEGEAYYDDDDAFEYIVDTIAKRTQLSDEQALDAAELAEVYMDAMQAHLEDEGLLDWE